MSNPVLSRRSIIVIALLVAAIAAAWVLWLRFGAGRMEDGCNLHERRCSAAVPGGGRVTIGIEPRPISLGVPWKIDVSLDNSSVGKVELDIAGLDVPTGFNRTQLTLVKAGRYSGEATLAVCLFEPLDWQVTVLLGDGDSRKAVPFVFNSDPAARPKSEPQDRLRVVAPGGGASLLVGANGKVAYHHEKGFATVVFAGYTQAPASCPQPIAIVDTALAKLTADELVKVRALMLALDPAGDAPARLQPQLQTRFSNYRVMSGADADLIGTTNLYGGAFIRRPPGPDGKPRIDHSAIFSILDPNGRLVGQLAAQDSDKLAAELRKALGTATPAPAPAAK